MGMIVALIAATFLGSAIIVATSRRLARSDEERSFTPPSFIVLGDEP